jgi:S1-C subfamily serine protease
MDPISLLVGALIAALTAISVSSAKLDPVSIAERSKDKIYRVEIKDQFVGTAFAMEVNGKPTLVTAGHICDIFKAEKVAPLAKAAVDDKGVRFALSKFRLSGKHDLCIMDQLPDDAPAFELSQEPQAREEAWAVGFPAGRALSVTSGMVVGKGRAQMPMQKSKEDCKGEVFSWQKVQMFFFEVELCVFDGWSTDTTVAVAPGSSGSPLLNADGEVIGVVSYLDSTTPGFGSTVPVEIIQEETK